MFGRQWMMKANFTLLSHQHGRKQEIFFHLYPSSGAALNLEQNQLLKSLSIGFIACRTLFTKSSNEVIEGVHFFNHNRWKRGLKLQGRITPVGPSSATWKSILGEQYLLLLFSIISIFFLLFLALSSSSNGPQCIIKKSKSASECISLGFSFIFFFLYNIVWLYSCQSI